MKNEYFDYDFLEQKIEIGDEVVFVTPGYRSLCIGKVITKAPKSCQIEYLNDWNYTGRKEVVRQGYCQIIKSPKKTGTMTNLERYQSMTAEEFAKEFWEVICDKRDDVYEACDDSCRRCLVDYLNAEYKEKDDD